MRHSSMLYTPGVVPYSSVLRYSSVLPREEVVGHSSLWPRVYSAKEAVERYDALLSSVPKCLLLSLVPECLLLRVLGPRCPL